MESMYFGDEDPNLVAESDNVSDKPKVEDEVLLFNEKTNSFSYSDGGGDVSGTPCTSLGDRDAQLQHEVKYYAVEVYM